MGKKRRYRSGGQADGFWRQEYGGAPMWFLALAVFAIVVFGAIGVNSMLSQPTAEARPQRPVPTFTFDGGDDTRPSIALFIGDSYSAGAGASIGANRWTTLASQKLGWTELNEARGGTGYVATAGVNGCGLDYCPTFGEMIASVDGSPDIVVISGGRNDGPPDADYEAGVRATLQAAVDRWPDARVVVTSPIWDDDAVPAWFPQTITAVRTAATAAGIEFLDIGEPLAGDASLVGADGVHPTDAGYQRIADAFVSTWPGDPTS